MNFSQFEVLTFDCYGTLIDWENGILGAVRSAFPELNRTDAEILSAYSEIEQEIQKGIYKSYRLVLRDVLQEMASRFNLRTSVPDALADSLGDWAPFSDTIPALRRLKQRYKLAIISNTDDDLFAATAKRLQVPFDHVITAQQAGSYKPALRNFEMALQRIGVRKECVLHVAESLFHDIAPARELGITNVWVNRRGEKRVAASRHAHVEPCLTVTDLTALAAIALDR